MFKKVLMPMDPRPESKVLLGRVDDLKKIGLESLNLLTVVDAAEISDSYYGRHNQMVIESVVEGQIKRTQKTLENIKRKHFNKNDMVNIEVVRGKTADEIVSFARRNDIDLIVMGARSESFISRFLGSITTRVLYDSPCPVVIEQFKQNADNEEIELLSVGSFFEHLLYVTDFSVSSWDVVDSLKACGDVCGEVSIYHVQEWNRIKHVQKRIDEFNKKDRKRMEQMAKDLKRSGIDKANIDIETGHPEELILKKARDIGASLITMAAKGRTNLAGVKLGSTAHKIISSSPLPVLLWPSDER